MYGFFPHVKEVEDIGLKNQPCKRSKTCLVIPKGAALILVVVPVLLAFAVSSRYLNICFINK
jgi:hypothetical protein